jgi:hypothetical protein
VGSFTPGPQANRRLLWPASPESLGGAVGSWTNIHTAQPWGTANLARYVPFVLDRPYHVAQLVWYVNTANNCDVGIYTEGGTRLVSTGSTAAAGGGTFQTFNITDLELGPGRYFWATAADNGGAQFGCWQHTQHLAQGNGIYEETSAFPLPATATFATITSNIVPSAGMRLD